MLLDKFMHLESRIRDSSDDLHRASQLLFSFRDIESNVNKLSERFKSLEMRGEADSKLLDQKLREFTRSNKQSEGLIQQFERQLNHLLSKEDLIDSAHFKIDGLQRDLSKWVTEQVEFAMK